MTHLPLNHHKPLIMHIDLDSCFASIEQQANPFLRNKPVVVAAYTTPNGCILSPSKEAKKYGIKTGMRLKDAQNLCSRLLVLPTDPPKYRQVHAQFKKIFSDYSPTVIPKSIDEAIIDFAVSPFKEYNLQLIAQEIKTRIRREIGDWISCSIGIATNRFWAKMGASLHKPDGLEMITPERILPILKTLQLIDLYGINTRYQARLNIQGIMTPVDFFNAKESVLRHQVFKGILGYYWNLRLRGWEIDDYEYQQKSIGHQYALGEKTADRIKLLRLLMKLCEKTGRRLRRSGQTARGLHLGCLYEDHTYWHHGHKFPTETYTTEEIFGKAKWIFDQQPQKKVVIKMAITSYDFSPFHTGQTSLFDGDIEKKRNVAQALDKINDRYGEFVIVPALMMDMDTTIKDAIAFGRIRELDIF
ncbi:hypothetical protein HY214_00195 [Candidatus Roizmanbacteria bacterium]|nr:hypothetical protein [Candidatus Roizmanbacteria bacterium]